MSRTQKSLCGVVGLVTAAAVAAHAFPTGVPLVGPTGLGTMPTTETVPANQVEVGAAYEHVSPDFGHVSFLPDLTATYGFTKGEVGAAYVRERDSGGGFSQSDNDFTLHAKYRFYDNPRSGLAFAGGAHYLHLDNGGGNVTSLYLTGSYDFLRPTATRSYSLLGHLGGLYQHVSGGGDSTDKVRPMVGLEFLMQCGFSVAADFIPKTGQIARSTSLTARYQMPSGFGVQVGVGQLQSDTKYFVGVTYRFGGHRGRGKSKAGKSQTGNSQTGNSQTATGNGGH